MIRRIIKILAALAIIAGTCISILYTIRIRSENDSSYDLADNGLVVRYTDSGKKYTSYPDFDLTWNPVSDKSTLIQYVDVLLEPKCTFSLLLYDNTYCDIVIPLKEYYSELNRSIFAWDRSYSIQVYQNITMDNLAQVAGLQSYDVLSKQTICTKENKKGMKVIATLVDDCAIIANVYKDDVTYSILRDSLCNEIVSYTEESPLYSDTLEKLDLVTASQVYQPQIDLNGFSLDLVDINFERGYLVQTMVIEPLYKVGEELSIRLTKISGKPIEAIYERTGVIYAQSGDYHLMCKEKNSNTTYVLIGKGEEAKVNIRYAIYNDIYKEQMEEN